ncbi:MAG: RdgB/HAM1 family non-canonical purine NTP pyrophosphatase [Anaerolineae bacterium]|nr:RdgB/HAM1 family non-canonical purine NTP pyrophosphatase [Thermoflexales bacterium]MDW8406667.1 RdgB/HAM1 family non-canonical purine NTP pyrophosphatase [Anaerolineae bacterium]
MNRSKPSVLLASNNAHKHRELRDIFEMSDCPVELMLPREIGIRVEPAEDADSYLGNARIKARAFAQAAAQRGVQVWVLADDSGLEVDALGGRPGLHSSRYHQQAPAGDGCQALLEELADVPDPNRTARFRAVIVLIDPAGCEHVFEGVCEGRISHEKRGANGFGFDPVFVTGDGRTMAELPAEAKHRISHRGIAARQAVELIRRVNDETLA